MPNAAAEARRRLAERWSLELVDLLGLDDADRDLSRQVRPPARLRGDRTADLGRLAQPLVRRGLEEIPAAAVDKLKAAERAWVVYRDAGCAVASELHAWPLGEDNAETCLMEETASRALDLRDMATDDYGQ